MRDVIRFKNKPYVIASSAIAGKKEKEGPLFSFFDETYEDTKLGEPTWEKAESRFVERALKICMKKANVTADDVDLLITGDLINQCTVSTFGTLGFRIPYIGIYGACSTYALGMILSAAAVDSGIASLSASSTSSHFCTAERQYRFPIEYGSQKTPTSQNTVTGAGCVILGNRKSSVYISDALIGTAKEMGIKDANNMGAAMAPAAAETIMKYLKLSGKSVSDFDMIVTGDLGYEGHAILKHILGENGVECGSNFTDCGILVYNTQDQDMHAGGSGCGCSAIVTGGYLMKLLTDGVIGDMLLVGTGALLSPLSVMQGQPIPGIAHLVRITSEKKVKR